jgi:Conserved TM helix
MWVQVQQALNQSMIRVLNELASLVPGLVALVIAVLFSTLVAGVLYFLLRRSLSGLHFDERLVRWGFQPMADWAPGNSPTILVARVVFWSIVLIGFLIGIAAFDSTLTSQLVLQLFAYLPNVLAAIVVLVVGNIVARFVARSVLIGGVNMNLQYARLVSLGVKWMILVLAVAMALEHLAIGGSIVYIAFGILFGGIVLTLALAIGLGSKELVSRSLEREATKLPMETAEPYRHL